MTSSVNLTEILDRLNEYKISGEGMMNMSDFTDFLIENLSREQLWELIRLITQRVKS